MVVYTNAPNQLASKRQSIAMDMCMCKFSDQACLQYVCNPALLPTYAASTRNWHGLAHKLAVP